MNINISYELVMSYCKLIALHARTLGGKVYSTAHAAADPGTFSA
jgi:hypothetical protein